MNSLVEEFSEFEKREDLFGRTYLGYAYWQSLRTDVYQTSVMKINGFQLSRNKRIRQKLIALFRLLLFAGKQIFCHQKIRPCDIILMDHRAGGDRFFDYWNLPKDITWTKINDSVNTGNLSWKDKNNLILPYIRCLIALCRKKILHRMERDINEVQFLHELEKKIKKRYGIAKSVKQMEDIILRSREMDHVYEKYFDKLFEKSGCKAVVVVCYYNTVLYPAYKAARKKGIRVIELQHGSINYHNAYWFEDQRGINNLTPDYLLAWGKMHISETKLLPNTRAVAVGFPYQERMLQKLSPVETEEKTIIIYPTQSREFERVINECAERLAPLGYRIVMKIHPLQVKDYGLRYPVLSKSPYLEIVTDQSKGIYYWLKVGTFHIVAHTTVGLEAIAFPNAKVCVAQNVPHDQNEVLLKNGLARGFSTADELVGLVMEHSKMNTDDLRDDFWKKNPCQNIKKFFARMKQQNWPSGLDYQE